MRIKDRISSALVIVCDYCGKSEIYYTSPQSKPNFEKTLVSIGWTINKHNALKCGPCNWKDSLDAGEPDAYLVLEHLDSPEIR